MLPVKPEDITVDVLDEVAREWESDRMWAVTRAEIINIGNQYRAARLQENRLEMQCMIRARRLFMYGITKKEMQDLFGVDRKVINKWTKGMK